MYKQVKNILEIMPQNRKIKQLVIKNNFSTLEKELKFGI